MELTARGPAAHGSVPRPDNAVVAMVWALGPYCSVPDAAASFSVCRVMICHLFPETCTL